MLLAGNAGAISGSSPVCPNSNQTYTIPAVSGAAYYTWTYSGTGATFSATTSSPSNIFTYASNATNGTITVTPVNACGTGSGSTKPITLTVVSPASINYTSGPNFCPNHSPANVTFSGPAGGNYTATPSGLTLNATTGLVTPSSSTSGNYTVSYNYSSNGCPVNATANVNIKPNVQITSSATPATICGSGNAQLNALADGGSSYSVSPITHNLLTPSGSPTVIYNSYTDDGVSPAIPLPLHLIIMAKASHNCLRALMVLFNYKILQVVPLPRKLCRMLLTQIILLRLHGMIWCLTLTTIPVQI